MDNLSYPTDLFPRVQETVTAQALRAVKVRQGSDTLEEWTCGAHTMGLNAGPRYIFEVAKAW
jgi:hypothetical protein